MQRTNTSIPIPDESTNQQEADSNMVGTGEMMGFASALDTCGSAEVATTATHTNAGPIPFSLALDTDGVSEDAGVGDGGNMGGSIQRIFSRYQCFSNRKQTATTLLVAAFLGLSIALYFKLPWVPVLEDILDWVDGRGIQGTLMLFGLHYLFMLIIFGPMNTLEYGWIYLRGWNSAIPLILVSYVVGIVTMLLVGRTVLRSCIFQRVQRSRVMQATQIVLDRHPYAWFVAFQFWSIVPWRATVYCAHVLAPHASLAGIGLAVLAGQLPFFLYGAFLASKITDLNSLVTGRLDTPLDTAIFWGSAIAAAIISIVLYVKIRDAFVEATAPSQTTTNDSTSPSQIESQHRNE